MERIRAETDIIGEKAGRYLYPEIDCRGDLRGPDVRQWTYPGGPSSAAIKASTVAAPHRKQT